MILDQGWKVMRSVRNAGEVRTEDRCNAGLNIWGRASLALFRTAQQVSRYMAFSCIIWVIRDNLSDLSRRSLTVLVKRVAVMQQPYSFHQWFAQIYRLFHIAAAYLSGSRDHFRPLIADWWCSLRRRGT